MLEVKKKICRKSTPHVSNKEKFAEPWRKRGAPDEMDQKSNLKFNQISKFTGDTSVACFAHFHSNALLNRNDFISFLPPRGEHSDGQHRRDFFSRNSMFLAKEEGKGNEGGEGARRREAWLLSGNLSAKLWMEKWEKKKQKSRREA